ncbi:MAG: response regulator, partial [Simkaniaceae bacterium]|nr:response regulator [Simkaniaceae bacterium]
MPNKKRILIADPASSTIRTVFNSPKAAEYEIRTAETATECLSQVVEFKPHLVIIELLIPEMHGLEVLKRIKSHKESATVGTVIASSLTMVQNYNAALALGIDYFLVKPFNADHFFWMVEEFFKGDLKPDAFAPKLPHYESNACYNPTSSAASSYMKFWGTRGSTSVAGAQYVQYGGNTACLELRWNDEIVIIDAGTGLRELGDHIDVKPGQKINLIIGHTHWDHITGFPFFAPLYNKDCTLAIWAPVGYEKSTEELFHDMLSFGYFPVRLEELYAKLEF